MNGKWEVIKKIVNDDIYQVKEKSICVVLMCCPFMIQSSGPASLVCACNQYDYIA